MSSPVVVSRIQNRRGVQADFDALYPVGYTGIGGCDINVYPNILLSGELALCTDSRRVFLGNLDGEYVEIPIVLGGGIFLPPLVVILPPVGVFTTIPELDYLPTPFFTLLYSLTDTVLPDWNTVGSNFSKNGELKITAIDNETPVRATLTDTGTEINLTANDISFMVEYVNSPSQHIAITYKHDFSSDLTFSTSTISWVPFA